MLFRFFFLKQGHLGMLVVRGRRKLSVLNVVLVVIVRSRVLYVMLCCPVVNVVICLY